MATTKAKAAKAAPKSNSAITADQVNQAIKLMVTSAAAFAVSFDSAARLSVQHVVQISEKTGEMHGDVTGCERLYNALANTGKYIGPKRQEAFMQWLRAFTPIRRNSKTGVFAMLKDTSPAFVAFDMDAIESTSPLDFTVERKKAPKMFSNKILADKIVKLLKKEYGDDWTGAALNTATITRLVTEKLQAT